MNSMRTGALSLLVACVAAACLAQADNVPSYLDITIEKQPDGGIVYVVNAEGGLRRKDLERRIDSFKEAADAQGKEVRARLRAASTLPYRE